MLFSYFYCCIWRVICLTAVQHFVQTVCLSMCFTLFFLCSLVFQDIVHEVENDQNLKVTERNFGGIIVFFLKWSKWTKTGGQNREFIQIFLKLSPLRFAGSNRKRKILWSLSFPMQNSYLGKFCFTSYRPKWSCSIRLQGSLIIDISVRNKLIRKNLQLCLRSYFLFGMSREAKSCPDILRHVRVTLICVKGIWLG